MLINQIVIPKLEDSTEIFKLINRNRLELSEWLPWVSALKSIDDEIIFLRDALKDKTKLIFAIKINKNIVGMIDLHGIDLHMGTAEVGYWLDKSYVGRGIMSKALTELEKLAKKEYKLKKLKIILDLNNIKSLKVAKTNNYRFIEQNDQNLIFEKRL